ncbi:MAG: pentapeptide repeat-containing protein [Leptolyngbyaceae cyanobacterium SM1_1_3]|nr:pentapeptide repeat-containing protein [Leptolyngbyaceae cyanobacterium SM1_1_3]NJN01383.1 pentapeptide repeat-containing protein [Leptolyngbyaceae cyanobacterium RM1_1_2]NJO10867.1 pentapeptide repeat-containing protein [Leptolyngbyaceae cyanobacterium SL_1_1]
MLIKTMFKLLLVALAVWLWMTPVYALDYPPPPSYSNALLQGQDFSGQQLRTAEFSNANLESTNFSGADIRGAIFSGSTATDTNFKGADLTDAMLDFAVFTRADFRDAVLVETLWLQSSFDQVDITGADFSDAILDGVQVKMLCAIASGTNSKTGTATRDSLGC